MRVQRIPRHVTIKLWRRRKNRKRDPSRAARTVQSTADFPSETEPGRSQCSGPFTVLQGTRQPGIPRPARQTEDIHRQTDRQTNTRRSEQTHSGGTVKAAGNAKPPKVWRAPGTAARSTQRTLETRRSLGPSPRSFQKHKTTQCDNYNPVILSGSEPY